MSGKMTATVPGRKELLKNGRVVFEFTVAGKIGPVSGLRFGLAGQSGFFRVYEISAIRQTGGE